MIYRVFVLTETWDNGVEIWTSRGKFENVQPGYYSDLDAAYQYAADQGMIDEGEKAIVTPAFPRHWEPDKPPRKWIVNKP